MNRRKIRLLAGAMLLSLALAAQQPPYPNGGNDPGGNQNPVGGGSPTGEGLATLLILSAAYAAKTYFRARKRLMN
jgi:hypothetical protein